MSLSGAVAFHIMDKTEEQRNLFKELETIIVEGTVGEEKRYQAISKKIGDLLRQETWLFHNHDESCLRAAARRGDLHVIILLLLNSNNFGARLKVFDNYSDLGFKNFKNSAAMIALSRGYWDIALCLLVEDFYGFVGLRKPKIRYQLELLEELIKSVSKVTRGGLDSIENKLFYYIKKLFKLPKKQSEKDPEISSDKLIRGHNHSLGYLMLVLTLLKMNGLVDYLKDHGVVYKDEASLGGDEIFSPLVLAAEYEKKNVFTAMLEHCEPSLENFANAFKVWFKSKLFVEVLFEPAVQAYLDLLFRHSADFKLLGKLDGVDQTVLNLLNAEKEKRQAMIDHIECQERLVKDYITPAKKLEQNRNYGDDKAVPIEQMGLLAVSYSAEVKADSKESEISNSSFAKLAKYVERVLVHGISASFSISEETKKVHRLLAIADICRFLENLTRTDVSNQQFPFGLSFRQVVEAHAHIASNEGEEHCELLCGLISDPVTKRLISEEQAISNLLIDYNAWKKQQKLVISGSLLCQALCSLVSQNLFDKPATAPLKRSDVLVSVSAGAAAETKGDAKAEVKGEFNESGDIYESPTSAQQQLRRRATGTGVQQSAARIPAASQQSGVTSGAAETERAKNSLTSI